jgi:hypothetical protein
MIDLVDFQENRQGHVVSDQFEIRFAKQMDNVRLLAGEKVVQTNDIVPLCHQSLAQMRPKKSCAARYENAIDMPHSQFLSSDSFQRVKSASRQHFREESR